MNEKEILANIIVFFVGLIILIEIVKVLKINLGPIIIALFVVGSISWFIKEVFL